MNKVKVLKLSMVKVKGSKGLVFTLPKTKQNKLALKLTEIEINESRYIPTSVLYIEILFVIAQYKLGRTSVHSVIQRILLCALAIYDILKHFSSPTAGTFNIL